MTADGYNWTLANAKAYSAKYGYVEVGAQYRVTDGKTRLFITLNDGRVEPQLGLGINGSVDVDWGDGSAHDTMTGSAVGTTVYQVHKYARAGNYIITLTVTGSARLNGIAGKSYILSGEGSFQVYLSSLIGFYCGVGMSFGSQAFQQCNNMRYCMLVKEITTLPTQMFQGCDSLEAFVAPLMCTTTDYYVFYNCIQLKTFIFSQSFDTINGYTFYACRFAKISLPESLTSIGGYAYQVNRALALVSVQNNASFASGVFMGNSGIGVLKFEKTAPPTIANITVWDGISSDCYILVPYDYLDDYINATNMPDDSTYLYLCYATYADGATLPTVDSDGYTLTWYASREDARAETNPISVGNGKEIYARGVEP